MVTFSIIRKSQLEGTYRLDAEYYQPEYLDAADKLRNAKKIAELANDIRYGLYVEPDYKEVGINFIRAMNLLNFWIEGEILKIDKNKVSSNYQLKIGDSLIVRSGANTGSVGVVYPRFENATFGSYIIRIRFNKINPFFASIFLNTKCGILQTKRLQTGMAQPNLNIPNIKEIKIPNYIGEKKQKEIEKLALEIEEKRQQGETLYSQAEDLLLEELGLKDFKLEEDLSYVVNLSEVKFYNRMDAEYFQPKYKKLIEKIKSRKSKLLGLLPLGEICSIRRGDFIDPNYYVDKSKRAYIRIKELPAKGDINLDAITYIDDNFSNANLETLLEGDFVFAGIGATLGKIARIPGELEGSFYSNNTARFRIRKEWKDKIDTHYLQVIFQSITCQRQFEQRQAQTAQAKIADEELRTVLIPILPENTQQKIADLVRKSHAASKEAKALLEKAKQKVEKAISGKDY